MHILYTAVQPFKDSFILDSKQGKTLRDWLHDALGFPNINETLLYRAPGHGWEASKFHDHCDDKGPTVTVAKSKTSFGTWIFGGFTEESWDKSGSYKRAPNSFLFSLVNPRNLPPRKMALMEGQEGYAIYCSSNYGPVFGQEVSGQQGTFFDLCFVNLPNREHCNSRLRQAYECPVEYGHWRFFTGADYFRVSEIEVFGLSKDGLKTLGSRLFSFTCCSC